MVHFSFPLMIFSKRFQIFVEPCQSGWPGAPVSLRAAGQNPEVIVFPRSGDNLARKVTLEG